LIGNNEKNLSTKQSTAKKDPRLSCEDGVTGRSQRAKAAQGKGAPQAKRLNPTEAAGLDAKFGWQHRLHHRHEFLKVQSGGVRHQTSHFAVYLFKSELEASPARLGITVSRKIGKSVIRNRIKRIVREWFRTASVKSIVCGHWIVVIARQGSGEIATQAAWHELGSAASALIEKIQHRAGRGA